MLFQWLVTMVAGWLRERDRRVIEMQQALIRSLADALRDGHAKRRILLPRDQKALLGRLASRLGRKRLRELDLVFSPDTLLRWHREAVARKYGVKRKGRPPAVGEETRRLVIRMAKENGGWGYRRIAGALKNLGLRVSYSTVKRILKEAGYDPSPSRRRRKSWAAFIREHFATMAAADFTTVEVWTTRGLIRVHLLFLMELTSRKVQLAGVVPEPDGAWMAQIARNAADCEEGFLQGKKHLLLDRAAVFTEQFRSILAAEGVKTVRLPPKSPNLNAHIERFMRSLKEECLDQMIFFGERHLERVARDYVTHYHRERNHQGLANQLIEPEPMSMDGPIQVRERAGGLMKFYYRVAA